MSSCFCEYAISVYTSPMDEPKRPPNDRGQGRKPLHESGELMKARPVRMTDEEWEKCKRLGGAAWIREKIRKAKD